MLNNINDKSGNVLLALLAGIGAGLAAGILLAPEPGSSTRESLKRKALNFGDELDQIARGYMRELEDLKVTGTGSSLQMQGTWDEVKGRLKSQYGDLSDEDLAYVEGEEDQLIGRLETKLGKAKSEIASIIRDI